MRNFQIKITSAAFGGLAMTVFLRESASSQREYVNFIASNKITGTRHRETFPAGRMACEFYKFFRQ